MYIAIKSLQDDTYKKQVVEVVKAIPEDAFTHIDIVIKELILLEE